MNEIAKALKRHTEFDWPKPPPFIVNPRGILIHRVRRITSYLTDGEPRHFAAQFWCGNSCCFDAGPNILVTDPPADRILCARCEAMAVGMGVKPADEIAGRHVHIGHLRAVRDCCKDDHN